MTVPDLRHAAFVFTCDPCAAEFFPDNQLPRVADVLSPRDWDWIGETRAAVVHAACTGGLVERGFAITDLDMAAGIELYCPHYKWDAALDAWAETN